MNKLTPTTSLLLLAGLTATASAAITSTRDSSTFVSSVDQIEGDSVPSSLADWVVAGTAPTASASGGVLNMTIPDASGDHAYRANGNYISSSTGWTWETRFKINSANETGPTGNAVWEIFMRDNDGGSLSATRVQFYAAGVGLDKAQAGNEGQAKSPGYLVDLTDGFHTIRGAVEAGTNATSVWVDGTLVYDGVVSNDFDAGELFLFGKWSSNNKGGEVDIDYLRFDTTGAFAPEAVPEPTAAALLGLGGISLILRRHR